MKRVKVKGESQTAVTKPKDTTASKQQENIRKLIKTVSLSSVEEDCNMDVKDADMKVDDAIAITITKHTDEENTSASSVHSLECTVVTADTDDQGDEQKQDTADEEEALVRDPDLPEVSPQESYNFFLNALLFVDTC